MTETLSQIQEDFEAFREECIDLRNAFNTYLFLYDSGDDETKRVLQETAQLFFWDLNGWLIEIIMVKIVRLTDPANTGERRNLSVHWILEELDKIGEPTTELNELADNLVNFGQMLRPARNRIIAHADLKTFRQQQTLGEHTKEDIVEFFENLQNFTDEVGRAIDVGPLDYRTQAGKGDVVDLVRALKRALKVKGGQAS